MHIGSETSARCCTLARCRPGQRMCHLKSRTGQSRKDQNRKSPLLFTRFAAGAWGRRQGTTSPPANLLTHRLSNVACWEPLGAIVHPSPSLPALPYPALPCQPACLHARHGWWPTVTVTPGSPGWHSVPRKQQRCSLSSGVAGPLAGSRRSSAAWRPMLADALARHP